ncbi:MAG: DegT/DnrJ/EryC1/StrS family aminotransferase [Chthoniobacterales bacterium]
MKNSLAIHGGEPVRTTALPKYVTIGEEEKKAVIGVMESGVLSDYLGSWTPQFNGGAQVQAFEKEWAAFFGVKHAITVNSNTSGLYATLGAAGIGPGDEVIVSPYSMCASATCAIVNHAVPVFADIDPDTFCISPKTILPKITPRTKAIVAVDIFGCPADMDGIMALAKKHNLFVLEDAAQAPGAMLGNRYAGTLGHAGVFSLNYHKTIHTGEGGVVVTNDDKLADRVRLIRNHAEVVVKAKGEEDITNMVGYNYRMTELEAAIGREQLRKLPRLLDARLKTAAYLDQRLGKLDGLQIPKVPDKVKHGYYVYTMRYIQGNGMPSREKIVAALRAEGIPVAPGYVEPIYLQPIYQRQIAFGKEGFPFRGEHYKGKADYHAGLCPITERMHFDEVIYGDYCHANLTDDDLNDICKAYEKVFANLESLNS